MLNRCSQTGAISPPPALQPNVRAGTVQTTVADRLETPEAEWFIQDKKPSGALAAPRGQSPLRRLPQAVQPFVPALIGVTALSCLAVKAAATFELCGYAADDDHPTTRFFSSQDGTIQGEVIAPWYADARACYISSQQLADNFLGVIMSACQVLNVTARGINGTGLHMPAYFEPNWFVHTNVNTYNVSGALSDTVACIFKQGNTVFTG